jgi:hypothetical protein
VSEYVVIFEQADDGGWGAYVPDVPGVGALGETRDDVAADPPKLATRQESAILQDTRT